LFCIAARYEGASVDMMEERAGDTAIDGWKTWY